MSGLIIQDIVYAQLQRNEVSNVEYNLLSFQPCLGDLLGLSVFLSLLFLFL